ncbi:MAG: orotidine-5'-phosphate decarboxylase [Rubrobacteraceae bacterium]|nr:orotidine-5'-phosphate decarboxylase [Rubrobacter sp.]
MVFRAAFSFPGGILKALVDSARRKKSVLVAGLDPAPDRLPEEFGGMAEIEAVRSFCLGAMEAAAPFAAAVKIQSAYFERLGPEGVSVYAEVIRAAEELELPTIADVKRGDIGGTAEAYAEAHLRTFGATCATVNPYMGAEAVEPFLEEARSLGRGGGAFVLAATSNPSSAAFGESVSPPLHEAAARLIAELGERTEGGYTDAGAVVGATRPEAGAAVREILPEALFLVPGYGAQGGGASSVRPLFDGWDGGVLVNSSRGILYAYEKSGGGYRAAAAKAAKNARDELRSIGARL